MNAAQKISVIVGLGNVGERYKQTRHNFGFLAIDSYRERVVSSSLSGSLAGGGDFREVEGNLAYKLEKQGLWLLKPIGFMNNSGVGVSRFLRFYKIPVSELVVLHDDLDLPLGVLRLKAGGGDGGHNGIKSLVASLGTSDFLRIKLGIGRPSGAQAEMEITDWVLGRFTAEEEKLVSSALGNVREGLVTLLDNGFKAAQTKINSLNLS